MKKRITAVLLIVMLLLSAFFGAAIGSHFGLSDSKDALNESKLDTAQNSSSSSLITENVPTRSEFAIYVVHMMGWQDYESNIVLPSFSDIEGNWAEKEIEILVAKHVICKSDYDGNFRPDEPITKAEISQILSLIGKIVESVGTVQKDNSKTDAEQSDSSGNSIEDTNPDSVTDANQYDKAENSDRPAIKPNSPKNDGKGQPKPSDTGKNSENSKDGAGNQNQDEGQKNDNPTDNNTGGQSGSDNSPGPSGGEQSGGSSCGSHSKPKAQVSFSLPDTAYTDTSIRIVPMLKNARTLRWTLTRANTDGTQESVDLTKILSGTLVKNGGTVIFRESGNYVLTATAVNSSGRETVCSHKITIYPIAGVAFSLPEFTHTDKTVPVMVSGDRNGLELLWSVQKDGKSVDWDSTIDGSPT